MKVTPSVASPGQVVTVTGRGFTNSAGNTGVTIHLSTRNGRAIAPTITPDTAGRINTSFPVPANIPAGWYLLIGTQTRTVASPSGAPAGSASGFTPGRTTLRIQGAKSGQATASAPGAGGSNWLPALMAGLVLTAAGVMLTARRIRSLNRSPLGV